MLKAATRAMGFLGVYWGSAVWKPAISMSKCEFLEDTQNGTLKTNN